MSGTRADTFVSRPEVRFPRGVGTFLLRGAADAEAAMAVVA
jgi:hypothetical protein